MFKYSHKRDRKFSFEEELENKLNSLRQGGNKTSNPSMLVHPRLERESKVLPRLLQETVEQLRKKQNKHNKSCQSSNAIRQDNKVSSLPVDSNFQSEEVNVYVHSILTNSELIAFFEKKFPRARTDREIPLMTFLTNAIQYFLPQMQLQNDEIIAIQKLCRELTTTNIEMLSINALEIIAKKIDIRTFLVDKIVATRVKKLKTDLQKHYNRLIEQSSHDCKILKTKLQNLDAKAADISKRNLELSQKQKQNRQKFNELAQRQSNLRKMLQDKCKLCFEQYQRQLKQLCDKIDKKINNFERNIRYKIEILQRRAAGLKLLRNEEINVVVKRNQEENQARIKVRKLEREMEAMEKKHLEQIDRYQADERDLLKSISLAEEQANKKDTKLKKYLQKIQNLEQKLSVSQEERKKAQEYNAELLAKLQMTVIEAPTQKSNRKGSSLQKQSKKVDKWMNLTKQLTDVISLYEQCLDWHENKEKGLLAKSLAIYPSLVSIQQLCSQLNVDGCQNQYLLSHLTLALTSSLELCKRTLTIPANNDSLYLKTYFVFFADPTLKEFQQELSWLSRMLGEACENNTEDTQSLLWIFRHPQTLFYLLNKIMTLVLANKTNNPEHSTSRISMSINNVISVIDIVLLFIGQDSKLLTALSQTSEQMKIEDVFIQMLSFYREVNYQGYHLSQQQLHLQRTIQALQKLSILIQRIVYTKPLQAKRKENITFLNKSKKYLESLEHSQHTLLIANLNSICELQQQFA